MISRETRKLLLRKILLTGLHTRPSERVFQQADFVIVPHCVTFVYHVRQPSRCLSQASRNKNKIRKLTS